VTSLATGLLVVRDATLADAGFIADVYNHYVRHGGATMDTVERSVGEQQLRLASMGSREVALVAELDGVLVGFCVLRAYSDRGGYAPTCETSTYLHPDARRRGVGSALKRTIIARARALNYHHLSARIMTTNVSSIEYNLKLGYEIVGVQRQVGFRDGRWIDIAIMQLILDDVPPPESSARQFRPRFRLPRSTRR
jgi:phosphinothricin acetyltransferase